jgi:hypothetical protein
MANEKMLYDDGRVACDTIGLTIARYYPWGAKRIAYESIRSIQRFPLKRIRGRWRLWGSGDFVHWYNLDLGRPHKVTAIEINVGRRVRPVITPDRCDEVEAILMARIPS